MDYILFLPLLFTVMPFLLIIASSVLSNLVYFIPFILIVLVLVKLIRVHTPCTEGDNECCMAKIKKNLEHAYEEGANMRKHFMDQLNSNMPIQSTWNIIGADVSETRDAFIIDVDLPGVKKEEIKVETDGQKVIISGNRVALTAEDEPKKLLSEIIFGEYKKIVTLSAAADMESVMAKYENGVLSIMVQKKKEFMKEKKTVNIE